MTCKWRKVTDGQMKLDSWRVVVSQVVFTGVRMMITESGNELNDQMPLLWRRWTHRIFTSFDAAHSGMLAPEQVCVDQFVDLLLTRWR